MWACAPSSPIAAAFRHKRIYSKREHRQRSVRAMRPFRGQGRAPEVGGDERTEKATVDGLAHERTAKDSAVVIEHVAVGQCVEVDQHRDRRRKRCVLRRDASRGGTSAGGS